MYKQLGRSVTKIAGIYAHGGYYVHVLLMDMELVKIMDEVPLVDIHPTTAREQHVGK